MASLPALSIRENLLHFHNCYFIFPFKPLADASLDVPVGRLNQEENNEKQR